MKHKMYNILKVVAISLLPVCFMAQSGNPVKDFSEKKYHLNHLGMKILTGWSSVNIIGGCTGYFLTNARNEKYFYAMNGGWGIINLGIALPSLLSKKKEYDSKIIALKEQTKTEKIFLANAFLDVTYITGGFLLKEVAKNQTNTDRIALFSGFGDSFILQGSALLVFDACMTFLNVKIRMKYLDPFMSNSTITFNSKGLGLKFQF